MRKAVFSWSLLAVTSSLFISFTPMALAEGHDSVINGLSSVSHDSASCKVKPEVKSEGESPDVFARKMGVHYDNGVVVRRVTPAQIKIPKIFSTDKAVNVEIPVDIPEGYKVIANQGKDRLLVVDDKGDLVVVVDGVFASTVEGSMAQAVTIQVVDGVLSASFLEDVVGRVEVDVLDATGKEHLTDYTMTRESLIGVPRGYAYDPSRGALHDYCTNSPDKFYAPGKSADFKGPCALHDMCYEKKKCASASCDKQLKRSLANNCRATYGRLNPLRASCLATADVYYGTVVSVQTIKSIFGSNKRCG
ncbi:hypothetical protein [Cutibacterium sp.]|uniref:hypothetical protein n=1 Tax=Cutibacterium sp. TaxID=1912221 RepID=UPI0026DD2F23|nr:hypothetical protein [Cutibacterium sp.]MDO4412548.1 hypothetical protein [Cutibacterium sp.]